MGTQIQCCPLVISKYKVVPSLFVLHNMYKTHMSIKSTIDPIITDACIQVNSVNNCVLKLVSGVCVVAVFGLYLKTGIVFALVFTIWFNNIMDCKFLFFTNDQINAKIDKVPMPKDMMVKISFKFGHEASI